MRPGGRPTATRPRRGRGHPGPARAAGRRARLGAAARRGRADAHACGPSCSDALGTIGGRSGRAGRGGRALRRSPGGRHAPVDPDIEGAVLAWSPTSCRPGDYEAVLERYRHPSTPRRSSATSTRWPPSPTSSSALRTFDLALGEVRTQDAPYLIAELCSPTGSAVRRCGSG